MDNSQKTIAGLAIAFIVYVGVTIPALIDYFKPKSYFEINGKKFTANDIEKDKPNLIYKPKKDYIEQLRRSFEQYANDKIFELEAKEKNIKPSEVLSQATQNYKPSQAEIQAVYEQFKAQIGDAKIEQVQDRIIGYLKNLKEREFYDELSKKYKIEFFMEDLPQVRQVVEEKGNPSLGPKDAKVTIIEFSDFECPYCQRSQQVNKQLREQYKDKIRWVFRDFPLPFHQDAKFAHIAANCAIRQNKYWEYFDLLFQNTGNLKKENVILLADKAKLDKKQFDECIANPNAIESEIASDQSDGQALGVNGTPAFFINGIFVEGAQPISNFQKIIDEELKK